MKSVEFVKKYGIEEVAKFVHFDSEIEIVYTPSFFEELKQFVWAFELVESKGGLVECKKILSRDNFTWCSGGSVCGNPLKRAVNLVEQCQ